MLKSVNKLFDLMGRGSLRSWEIWLNKFIPHAPNETVLASASPIGLRWPRKPLQLGASPMAPALCPSWSSLSPSGREAPSYSPQALQAASGPSITPCELSFSARLLPVLFKTLSLSTVSKMHVETKGFHKLWWKKNSQLQSVPDLNPNPRDLENPHLTLF